MYCSLVVDSNFRFFVRILNVFIVIDKMSTLKSNTLCVMNN